MSTGEADRLAAQAARHHRDGHAAEAERFYRAALSHAPAHAESLHGLGCLAHAAGRADVAIGLIGQAVAVAPAVAHYTISLGLALLDRGHVEEARAALHVASLRDPEDPRAHRALAQALSRLGRLPEAEASLREALRLDPASAAGLMALGSVLQARGDPGGAIAAFGEAARRVPGDPLVWHALASACGSAGDLAQAEAAFRTVAALLPADAAAQANLGTALFARGAFEEARDCLLRADALAPRNPATLSSLGLVRMGLGETVEAEAILSQATRLAPGSSAIAINHGTALAALERDEEAETLFRAVLERNPSDPQARFNLATQLLARGALEEGWAAFEARLGLIRRGAGPALPDWALPDRALPDRALPDWALPDWALPDWDGAPVPHGRVLVRAEQGLGDAIQFLRWIVPAAARAPIVLELPAELLGLVQGSGLFDRMPVRVQAAGGAADDCVATAALLSLPHVLRHPAVPSFVMRADPGRATAWAGRLQAAAPAALRVGLVWAGSASYRFDRQRSLTLAQLAPLAELGDVQFVSLQQGEAAGQALAPPRGMSLFVPDAPFEDLADTAALIESLDLVVSVDTAIAHLAASLGKPVWLLDRFGGDWRWRAGFEWGRAWYPTLRRFAQMAPLPPSRAWEETIAELAGALRTLRDTAPARPPR